VCVGVGVCGWVRGAKEDVHTVCVCVYVVLDRTPHKHCMSAFHSAPLCGARGAEEDVHMASVCVCLCVCVCVCVWC